jgi:deoxyribodipyrimidine photo-lyase
MTTNKYENGLFIFRRDLRIVDNNGLNIAARTCKKIYTVFIFTPEQVSNQNKFKSDNAVQFMIESLQNLSQQIRQKGGQLVCFYGNNDKIVNDLIDDLNIDYLCFNLDYTPYAIERDMKLTQLCEKKGITIDYGTDYYLHEPGTIFNGQGQPYQKFTPYYDVASKKKVDPPADLRKFHFASSSKHLQNTITLDDAFKRFIGKPNPDILVHGGRTNAIKQMKIASKNIAHYAQTRDELSKPTSQLSSYIKFGCVSIREVYKAFRSKNDFIRQIFWREYYANILYSFPRVLGHALKPKYDKIRWHHNSNWFKKWCDGETGFPVVDASQRQLLQTGWTHNRGRMISSSILTKILLIDWREGERFYAQHLVDYDVANNNGGWQFSAGTGADAQSYFRYFNPYLQSKEHDPKCEYIKKWIPELKNVPDKDIHNWDVAWEKHKDCGYPKPIVDYKEQKEKSIKIYKNALY